MDVSYLLSIIGADPKEGHSIRASSGVLTMEDVIVTLNQVIRSDTDPITEAEMYHLLHEGEGHHTFVYHESYIILITQHSAE